MLYREGETRAFHDLAPDWAESFRLGGRDFVDALREGRQPAQDGAAGETRTSSILNDESRRTNDEGIRNTE